MAIVTFLSDFGDSDHYVAAVKAGILGINPNITIIDITHKIKPCDIGNAAFALGEVFRSFPKGSVHLVGVLQTGVRTHRYLAVKLEEHFFVGSNSGIYNLISGFQPTAVVDINAVTKIESTFPVKHILGPVAAKIASGQNIHELGPAYEDWNRLTRSSAKATKKQIAGNIVHIDHFGNLITNIVQQDFEQILKINKDCPYEINFKREKFTKLNRSCYDVTAGECFVYFNSNNKLEIGINQGHGSELLGLRITDQVFIDFLIEHDS